MNLDRQMTNIRKLSGLLIALAAAPISSCAHAQIDLRAVPEAQTHQACTSEQGDGERELDHDECVTETPTSVPGPAAPRLFQRVIEIRSTSLPGLRRAAQRAGEHRRPQREQ